MDRARLIASTCRQKIMKELSKSKEINIMALVRRINSTYNEVNRNIKILEAAGIVTNNYRGHLRVIRLSRDGNRTALLLQVLNALDSNPDAKTSTAYFS